MKTSIGFIGAGNMGGAMIGGIVESKLLPAESVWVSDLDQHKLDGMAQRYGVSTTTSAEELVKACDMVIVAVKPNIYPVVLESIKAYVSADKLIVSIAAGVTIAQMEAILGETCKIVRTMPNTPALVGEGMSALCPNSQVSKEELEDVINVFNSFGHCEVVKESLIDSVIGVAGSAPAYVFMFIEAMADAAVLGGMPRPQAYKFAAQAVLGSAKMVMETGKHPGELKDMVCSPGGTTIEAVKSLEKHGFRSAVIEAISDCIDKSKKMSS